MRRLAVGDPWIEQQLLRAEEVQAELAPSWLSGLCCAIRTHSVAGAGSGSAQSCWRSATASGDRYPNSVRRHPLMRSGAWNHDRARSPSLDGTFRAREGRIPERARASSAISPRVAFARLAIRLGLVLASVRVEFLGRNLDRVAKARSLT